jgi:anti-sigma regulatory factor (Ser/Thr protein kinase)
VSDEVVVRISTDADTVAARQAGRDVASRLGFSRTDATFIATAISEIARNILAHAGDGEIVIRDLQEDGRKGIVVIARDDGPGIKDVEAVLQQEFGTGVGLGMGLWGARRLMDEVVVDSSPGRGTTVTMKKWRGVDEVALLLGDGQLS